MDTLTLILANAAQRLNDHSDLLAEPESVTDQHRAALMDVIQAVKNVQQNDSEAARDRLRDVLDEAGNVHRRYNLTGSDWMHAAAHVLDPLVDEENKQHYNDVLHMPQRRSIHT